jgi:4-amino-4-deoxy-L-arabinose transferase-like glycosyltransferase
MARNLPLSQDEDNRRTEASELTLIELYLIAALAALVAYFVTGRLRPRDRVATVFVAALVALTLTAVLARAVAERTSIRPSGAHIL